MNLKEYDDFDKLPDEPGGCYIIIALICLIAVCITVYYLLDGLNKLAFL